MKKFITSFIVIGGFMFYSFLHNKTNSTSPSPTSNPSVQEQPTPTSSLNTNNSGTVNSSSTYKDGAYVGSEEDAFYGYIQVRATIQNGQLADIEFLKYPNDHRESIEINTQAMPILREEAIQAQSAHVDTVTRATDTSIAFRESLASALSQAEN